MWGVGGRSSRHGSPLLPQVLTPPPCLLFLPSWPPSLAAILLPVVYFLFCFSAEEMGGKYPWPANPTCRFSSTLCREGCALWGTETVSKPNHEQNRIRWRFSSLDEITWLELMCALLPMSGFMRPVSWGSQAAQHSRNCVESKGGWALLSGNVG